jgi:microsomal dipeptidase-like Zn-dependent dipeptidase
MDRTAVDRRSLEKGVGRGALALLLVLGASPPAPAIENGCYAIKARSTNRYLSHNNTAFYRADRETIGAWEKFYIFRISASRYLIHDSGRHYLSSDGIGGVGKATRPDAWEVWEISDLGGGDYAFRSVAHGRWLSAEASILWGAVNTKPQRSDWERWGIQGVSSGCAVPPQPSFSVDAGEGCWGIYAHSTGRFLSHNGVLSAVYRADRETVGEWERFYLEPAGSGTFLIRDSNRQYVSSNGIGGVGKAGIPNDWEEWKLIPLTDTTYALESAAHSRYLSAEATVLWGEMTTKPARGAWEVFSFVADTGCCSTPEPELGTDAGVPPSPPGEPIWGIADTHSHMFSNEGFGGAMFQGKPFHPCGIDAALAWCDGAHGPGGTLDLVGAALDQFGHKVGGAPQFDGWPRWNSSDHQQMYHRWLERAHRGGLRLQVLLAVNNQVLCEKANRALGHSCDDMEAVDRQLAAAREIEAFIDARSGGAGKGWFRIVESASQARAAIESGKMAVVLGIEVDSLFGCKVGECDEAHVREQLDKYHGLGVRHIFPVHVFDNAFGGAALYNGLFTVGNKKLNGDFFEVEDCSRLGFEGISYDANLDDLLDQALALFSVGAVPGYPSTEGGHCNTRSLTPLGEFLIREMMDRKLIIDVDHMSALTLDRVLEIAESEGYPVAAGHTGFLEISGGQGRSEAQKSLQQVERIRALGGLVAPILHQGDVEEVPGHEVPNDCKESSKAWAQAYLYAVDAMGGEAVPLGSDLNGFIHMPAPRFGDDGCKGEDPQQAAQGNPVIYPFSAHGLPGTFERLRTGDRVFDYNTDGFANVGMLPDFIEDLKMVGLSDADLEPLFRSAEAYVRMWERIEAGANPRPRFRRGDANADGAVNISDPIFTLDSLFAGRGTPPCSDAADSNDDGAVNISDPIATLSFLFAGGFAIPPPHGACGEDPTASSLTCTAYPHCP